MGEESGKGEGGGRGGGGGWGDALRGWDGNAIKLGCEDCCTTINVIKFIKSYLYLYEASIRVCGGSSSFIEIQ